MWWLQTGLFTVSLSLALPYVSKVAAGFNGPVLSFERLACKRKEQEQQKDRSLQPKKQRLVTDLQRRTLIAIFKENKRPSKEMQMTISQQLGLELNTVSNFFMNARRRCMNRWQEEPGTNPGVPSSSTSTFSKA
ncbi:LOW QUALITY PROTEIN: one cut domain family member 3 [Porphyrio hochstetteri]